MKKTFLYLAIMALNASTIHAESIRDDTEKFMSELMSNKARLKAQKEEKIKSERQTTAKNYYTNGINFYEQGKYEAAKDLLCSSNTIIYQPSAQKCAFIRLKEYFYKSTPTGRDIAVLSETVKMVVDAFDERDTVSQVNLGLLHALRTDPDIESVSKLLGASVREGQFTVEEIEFIYEVAVTLSAKIKSKKDKASLESALVALKLPIQRKKY